MGLSESSFNPQVVSNQNNVRIIDPNPLGETVPHEDLFIFVSLKAKQKSKSLITQVADDRFSVDTDAKNTIDLITPQQTTTVGSQQLFSSKSMLTTEWTEIGGHRDVDLYKDFEGFGITNIDINIKSQIAPKVIIDFVDVRGATLFEQGSCSPYGLFFNLPYPIFELTVKGYYGRPAKYYLNLVKFNTKFNPDTGNMECRGEFIGYSFAFLSDTIVGYVAASQYLKPELYSPQQKLKDKYEASNSFYLANGLDVPPSSPFCNNPVIGEGRCMTIHDLLFQIKNFDQYTKPEIASSPEFNKLQNLLALQNSYENYREAVNKFMRDLSDKGCKPVPTKVQVNSTTRLPIQRFEIPDNLFNSLMNKESGLIPLALNPKGGILPTNIVITKTKKITDSDYGDSQVEMLTSAQANELNGGDLNNTCPGCSKMFDKLNKEPWHNILGEWYQSSAEPAQSGNTSSVKFIDLGYIIKNINEELDKLSGDNGTITTLKKEIITTINGIVASKLGFKPTIRNIFTILLCNVDAFMEILREVATKAEKLHDEENYDKYVKDGGDSKILGTGIKGKNGPKIFSWPTYFKQNFTASGGNGQKQGSKEAYPGVEPNFTNWVEVRFVEDFIDAFLEFQRKQDLLNDKREGKPGFDNYVPINPLEAPIWGPTPGTNNQNPIKYYGMVSPDEIYTTIGERLFIALDHTLFSPVRLTLDGFYEPSVGVGSWNPIKNDDSGNIAPIIGTIEAWNILNALDKDSTILGLMQTDNFDEFKNSVINGLKKEYGDESLTIKKASSGIRRLNPSALTGENLQLGFNDEDYYVFDTKSKGGIRINSETQGNSGVPIMVTPDPYDMSTDNIIQFLEVDEQTGQNGPFEIKIVPEDGDFATAVSQYANRITDKTAEIKFATSDFDAEGSNLVMETPKGQQIADWDDARLFTTLAAFGYNDTSGSQSWWSQKNLNSLGQSNMGLVSYWDYNSGLNGGDETLGITFFKGPNILNSSDDNIKFDGSSTVFDLQDGLHASVSGDEDGVGTSFITTPLWLDNVNSFRINGQGNNLLTPTPGTFYLSSSKQKDYSSEEIQNRNLAYLWLHTMKPTPLIVRYINTEGEFTDIDGKSSYIYALKAFNSVAGVVKVPKFWALSLGAELWRWKMFVGTKIVNGKRVWNKPLTCETCTPGDIPNGFDPLSQPGWNSVDNGSRVDVDRNLHISYLDKIYNTTKNWSIQESSFSTPISSTFGTFSNATGYAMGGASDGTTPYAYLYFQYYNTYKNKIGYSTLENKLLPQTFTLAQQNYSWPQLWIAPHHIPYVHPERFFGDEGEATAYVQLFTNNTGYIDYQTLMPARRAKTGTYFESDSYDYRLRGKIKDGNLGMVVQHLPDDVKDKFIEFFEDWCADSNKWPSLLKVVDPVNFGSNGVLTDSYYWDTDSGQKISHNILGNSNDTATLVLKKDGLSTSLKKLMTDQVWILNSTPKIWYGIDSSKDTTADGANKFYDSFLVSTTLFDQYLKSLFDEYKKNKPKRIEELNTKSTEEQTALGDSVLQDDDVKLSLYRTFKSLTDKWISASDPINLDKKSNLFFNIVDDGKHCGKGDVNKPTLAAHFQYVNRVMGDIGDLAVLDVTKLSDLKDNIKISLYEYIGNLLTDNEYLFFPLPSYINFTAQENMREEDLKDMFRPVLSLDNVSCGPLFLSMYMGGSSRQLKYNNFAANCPQDLKDLKQFEDDSFLVSQQVNRPYEIENPQDVGKGGFTAFKVVYGLENQNHFKNIQLDQAEFSETAESLLVIDKLSKNGGTDQTTKGQNLNSVYLTRSYTCQVESLGNMMIQPMTYFDLIGVPMFNGAYLITEVNHNIKPNNASTSFKGTRQARFTVPIITDAAVAMNMSFKDMKTDGTGKSLNTIKQGTGGSGSGSSSGVKTNGKPTDSKNFPPPTGEWRPGVVAQSNSSIYGIVKKEWKDDDVVKYIQAKIEGGYYHPVMEYLNPTKFERNGVPLYDNSGETMFGEDRAAGQTETLQSGKDFWALVDKNSGYGKFGTLGGTSDNNYSRSHTTRNWEKSKLEEASKITNGWKYNFIPTGTLHDQLQALSRKIATERLDKNFNTYFKSAPDLLKIVKSDGRFLFLYYRASFNGVGFFKAYANNLINVYNGGERNVEKLMEAELDFRWAYAERLKDQASTDLIKGGVVKYGTSIGWAEGWA